MKILIKLNLEGEPFFSQEQRTLRNIIRLFFPEHCSVELLEDEKLSKVFGSPCSVNNNPLKFDVEITFYDWHRVPEYNLRKLGAIIVDRRKLEMGETTIMISRFNLKDFKANIEKEYQRVIEENKQRKIEYLGELFKKPEPSMEEDRQFLVRTKSKEKAKEKPVTFEQVQEKLSGRIPELESITASAELISVFGACNLNFKTYLDRKKYLKLWRQTPGVSKDLFLKNSLILYLNPSISGNWTCSLSTLEQMLSLLAKPLPEEKKEEYSDFTFYKQEISAIPLVEKSEDLSILFFQKKEDKKNERNRQLLIKFVTLNLLAGLEKEVKVEGSNSFGYTSLKFPKTISYKLLDEISQSISNQGLANELRGHKIKIRLSPDRLETWLTKKIAGEKVVDEPIRYLDPVLLFK